MGVTGALRLTPRLLLVLPQLPHDPASGAARTASTIAELLAQSGFCVQTIGTTGTEGHAPVDVLEWLAGIGVAWVREVALGARLIRFNYRNVDYTLLDTGDGGLSGWEASRVNAYDCILDQALACFKPDIVFTYGGSPVDVGRQRRARMAGARVIFGLYNDRYLIPGFFDHVDDVITPSEFLSALYRDRIGLKSRALLTPLWHEDVASQQHDPTFVTMVNPCLEKGLVFFATFAAALGERYPHIPIEVYTSRTSPHFLMQAAMVSGVDLCPHPNLVVHSTVAAPREIFRRARVVIVPSLVEDAAPRVIAEALVNGVPPVASDRGGIPEMCVDAGFVLPIPRSLDPRSLQVPPPEIIRPWVERIAALFADDSTWRAESERALRAGAQYLPPSVTSGYVAHFEDVLRR